MSETCAFTSHTPSHPKFLQNYTEVAPPPNIKKKSRKVENRQPKRSADLDQACAPTSARPRWSASTFVSTCVRERRHREPDCWRAQLASKGGRVAAHRKVDRGAADVEQLEHRRRDAVHVISRRRRPLAWLPPAWVLGRVATAVRLCGRDSRNDRRDSQTQKGRNTCTPQDCTQATIFDFKLDLCGGTHVHNFENSNLKYVRLYRVWTLSDCVFGT